jgi:glycosyltransferase involved in cell wall biosynthesis
VAPLHLSDRLRLLVVTQYFWPEEFRINDLVAELQARGHEVTILTGVPNYPSGSVFPSYARDAGRFRSYGGAEVIRVPMMPRGRGKMRLALNYASFAVSATVAGIASLAGRRFDAIFVFEPSPITVGIPAVALRAIHGWPVAFWVLDQWPESLVAVGAVRSPRILSVVGRLARFIYARCDLILTTSKSIIPLIAKYCAPGQRIEYFPNWMEAAFTRGSAEAAPQARRVPGVFSVMFAGNIGEAQDFPAILAAAERLRDRRDIRWIIVGDGRMAQWVREEVERRGLGDRVVMLGRLPTEHMPALFAEADALLVSLKPDPVFSLTAPGKIQSYLAAGVPVLAMLDGEGASVIQEADAGLTSPAGDGAALAGNVARLAAMPPAERRALGQNGKEFAQRDFSMTVLIDRLEGWLQQMRRDAKAA